MTQSPKVMGQSAFVMDRRPKIPSNHNRTIFGNPATTKTLTPTATVMSNGGDCRYEIAQNAYIKLVLHALKHKTSAVNGVLLGRLSGDVVEITESVPLFHSSQIGLLPPLEIALIMIEEYYSSQGLSIVGYFHANERFDDIELGTVAKNIADHVHRYFPQAAVLLVR